MITPFRIMMLVALFVTYNIFHQFFYDGDIGFLSGYVFGGVVVASLWFVSYIERKPSTKIKITVEGNDNEVVSTVIESIKK